MRAYIAVFGILSFCTLLPTVFSKIAVVREVGTMSLHDNSVAPSAADSAAKDVAAEENTRWGPVANASDSTPASEQDIEKMMQEAGLTDAELTAGMTKSEVQDNSTLATNSTISTLATNSTIVKLDVAQAVAGIKAHNRSASITDILMLDKDLSKKEEKSLDKVLSQVAADTKKKKKRSAMGSGNKIDADSTAEASPVAKVDATAEASPVSKVDGEEDEPKIVDEGIIPVGVLGSSNAENRQEQIFESKFVYGFLIAVVLFTVWWTQGSSSKWQRAIQWEVQSACVPGVGRPQDMFEEEYNPTAGKKGNLKQTEGNLKQTEMKKRTESPDLL